MIRGHIEQAIRSIEAEKEQKLREVEQRVMQEKVLPFNREIDESRDKAIQQLSTEYNVAVNALQEKFAKDKNDIILASEQHKKVNADAIISAESKSVEEEYGIIIAELTNSLNKVKE